MVGTKSYIGMARNTYFVFLTLRTCEPWGLVRLGKRNTLCYKNGMQIYFFFGFMIFYFAFYYILCVKFL